MRHHGDEAAFRIKQRQVTDLVVLEEGNHFGAARIHRQRQRFRSELARQPLLQFGDAAAQIEVLQNGTSDVAVGDDAD